MKEIRIKELKCKRCRYKWFPRIINHKPKQCPKCKRIDWEK